jgi:hypothetical protein
MNRTHPTAHSGISRAFAITVLVFIVLAGLTFALIRSGVTPGLPSGSQTSVTQANTSTLTTQPTMAGTATLNDLISGKFPTALDKAGTGGVTVTVTDLQVIYVRMESDGDWHVAVTDGVIPVFITEITPSYQAALGQPQAGSIIQETGIVYCDTVHETESWHGNTCWEIHPVTSWHVIGTSAITPTTKVNGGLQASISYAHDPIPRGSAQAITIHAQDSDGAVVGAIVSVEVDYASGSTSHTFSCTTSPSGSCSVTWTIGSSSTPGTFQVIVDVEGAELLSTFTVTA